MSVVYSNNKFAQLKKQNHKRLQANQLDDVINYNLFISLVNSQVLLKHCETANPSYLDWITRRAEIMWITADNIQQKDKNATVINILPVVVARESAVSRLNPSLRQMAVSMLVMVMLMNHNLDISITCCSELI